MRYWHSLVLLLVGALFSWGQSQPPERGIGVAPIQKKERRVALVIGNATYAESPLRNPVNDARAIAKALRECGFEVSEGFNQSREQMLRAIETFRAQLTPSSIALFYFAGHGMQINEENFLIPVDARIQRELDVEIEGVKLARILNGMNDARSRVNLVILDACRNNPFARSFRSGAKGLSDVVAPSGTLIAYATAPRQTASDGSGDNGLYTEELLSAIRTPGLLVEQVFKRVRERVEAKSAGAQTPWENSSLKGDFYFVAASGTAPQAQQEIATSAPVTQTAAPVTREAGRWEVVAERSLNIYANEAWTDTRIQIKPGQDVRLRVDSPEIDLGSLGRLTPEGTIRNDPRKPRGDCDTGVVIARIGQESFCVGRGRSFTATSAGSLSIGLNEGNIKDNRGSFVVKVLVQELR